MIVVDANVLIYLVLPGDYSVACSALYSFDPDWHAPRLWRDEVLNVLATYERQGMLSRVDALRAFAGAVDVIGSNEYDLQAERVLSVAARTQCSGYDAQYVSLAEDLGLTLYTFDYRVLKAVPDLAIRPE